MHSSTKYLAGHSDVIRGCQLNTTIMEQQQVNPPVRPRPYGLLPNP